MFHESMDREMKDLGNKRSGSFNSAGSANSSRRLSSRLSFSLASQVDRDDDNDSVSKAGDVGDRALHSKRHSDSGGFRLSVDGQGGEHGTIVPISEDTLLHPSGFWSHDPSATANTVSPVSPFTLSTGAALHAGDEKKGSEDEEPWLLEYLSCLAFLASFGILGVLLRYGLQKLFGPGVVGATSDHSYMYLDLPSNMVGSFLMGWFGVIFKKDITNFSDKLAIGLSTGFLGSLTTFSGWNQKMIELSVDGQWVFAFLGILIGLFLVAYSIIFGIETAKGVNWIYRRSRTRLPDAVSHSQSSSKGNTRKRHLFLLLVIVLLLSGLWCMSAILEIDEFKDGGGRAQLWLGCIVGPFGVWMRWFLARLNGRGLGKSGFLRWVPFGTLAANVSAACVMAALATLKAAVNTKNCDTIATGIQFGFLGCLSTVSTFIAEFHAMRESQYPWRAYAYAMRFSRSLISMELGNGNSTYPCSLQ